MSNRRGFTLVEVVVAVFILDVALMALVAGSAVLVAQTNELKVRTLAVHAAGNRLQALGAGSCAPLSGSAVTGPDLREWFTVAPHGRNARDVRDSVAFLVAGGQRSIVLQTRLPC